MKNLKKNIASKLKKPLRILKEIELSLIHIYQKTLSLDHGYFGKLFPNTRICRYTPTCSEYGYKVVEKFGILKGNYLLVKRILRCNPWTKTDRYDPIPEN